MRWTDPPSCQFARGPLPIHRQVAVTRIGLAFNGMKEHDAKAIAKLRALTRIAETQAALKSLVTAAGLRWDLGGGGEFVDTSEHAFLVRV